MAFLPFNLRFLAIAIVVLCLLSAYGGSYYRLSRRGLEEAKVYDVDGFFYTPIQELTPQNESAHLTYVVLYMPANFIDRAFFGGKRPSASPLWNLSG